MIYDNGCLEKLNLISWTIDIGFAVVPAIPLFFGILFLNKKLKGTKYDLARLFKSRDGGPSFFKIKLIGALCVLLVVPPALYIKVNLVDPVVLEMYKECWAIVYPRK